MKVHSVGFNMPYSNVNKFSNKNKVSFKGIEEVIKEEGDLWNPKNGVANIKRKVSYHPFLDEDFSEYAQIIGKTREHKGNMGLYTQVITTKTILGQSLPVTKKEAKKIPYDVLLSMASRLEKSVGNNIRKQNLQPISNDIIQNKGKRFKH